jgi:hypothetical protein
LNGAWLRAGRKRSEATLLEIQTAYVEAAGLPVEQQAARFKQLGAASKAASLRDPLARLLLSNVEKVSEAFLRNQALLRCTVTALAAERFRRTHQLWPNSLDELVQESFLKAVPLDPWDGKPLRWQPTPDGIRIYSVGLDGKDDGGNLSKTSNQPGTDWGFQLLNVARRRQPAHEWIAAPRPDVPPDPPVPASPEPSP